MKIILCMLVLLALCLGNAAAQDDLIHSDVPLYAYDLENVWPKHFANEESFGCIHNVKLGDWEYTEQDEIVSWYRLNNYGAIHCYLIVGEEYDQDSLAASGGKPSLLVNLGLADTENGAIQLWALQMGGRPGSDYLLLSSAIGDDQISSFEVLKRNCPERNVRVGPSLDILSTRYCAINTKKELVELTTAMVKQPPLGKLRFSPREN